jgi:hypothetical protein
MIERKKIMTSDTKGSINGNSIRVLVPIMTFLMGALLTAGIMSIGLSNRIATGEQQLLQNEREHAQFEKRMENLNTLLVEVVRHNTALIMQIDNTNTKSKP